jgi:hypothetical protein
VYISLVVVEVALIIKDISVDRAQVEAAAVEVEVAQMLMVLLAPRTQVVAVVAAVMLQVVEQEARVLQLSVI